MNSDDVAGARAQFQTSQDPYLDQFWGILKNKVHARTQSELEAAEADLVVNRQTVLAKNPVVGNYDLDHLKAIHGYLFQDVYPFAGQLRTIDMHKADDPGGRFFPATRLEDGGRNVFSALAEDNHLKGMSHNQYIERLGHHLDAMNHLHPFREGNGRAQRAFVDSLSNQAGYVLDWSNLTKEQNDQASKQGATALSNLLECVVTIDTERDYLTRITPSVTP